MVSRQAGRQQDQSGCQNMRIACQDQRGLKFVR